MEQGQQSGGGGPGAYQPGYGFNPSYPQQGLGMQAPLAGYPQGQPQPLAPHHAEQLRGFWQEQLKEVHQVPCDPAEFKNHQLPLARIKKIMKSDEDVRMISAEAPVLFAKACEMFILELTLRSWYHAEENKRRTLQRNDVAAAIFKTDIFDFLIDIVPREDLKAEGGQEGAAGTSGAGGAPQMPGPVPPNMYGYPYSMPPGAGPDASGMMRPPGMPPVDPTQMMAYQAQFMQQMAGQGWPAGPTAPPPTTQPSEGAGKS